MIKAGPCTAYCPFPPGPIPPAHPVFGRWELRSGQHWPEFGQQGLDVFHAVGHLVSMHVVFVEVLVQGTGGVEQAADVAVAGFGPEPADDSVIVTVTAVVPAALIGDGLEHLGGGSSALLGGLRQIAGDQFPSGLLQKMRLAC